MAAILHPEPRPLVEEPRRPALVLAPPPTTTTTPTTAATYWRRRCTALALVVALTVGAVALVSTMASTAATANADIGSTRVTASSHVVQRGDSYWSIAVSLGEGGDVRAVVDRLVAINRGQPLEPGDRIALR